MIPWISRKIWKTPPCRYYGCEVHLDALLIYMANGFEETLHAVRFSYHGRNVGIGIPSLGTYLSQMSSKCLFCTVCRWGLFVNGPVPFANGAFHHLKNHIDQTVKAGYILYALVLHLGIGLTQ
jgi:hypothetical protein